MNSKKYSGYLGAYLRFLANLVVSSVHRTKDVMLLTRGPAVLEITRTTLAVLGALQDCLWNPWVTTCY